MNHSKPNAGTAALTCVVAGLMAVPCLGQEPLTEAEQLATARNAVLGERTVPANLIATGTAKFFGVEGPLTIWLGEGGEFRSLVESKVGEQFCWGGSSGFKVDLTGMPSSFGLFELDPFRLLFAAVGGGWAAPDSGIDHKFESDVSSSQAPQIAVHSEHRNLDGRITLHRDTHRPDTLDFVGHRALDPARDEYWKFDNFVNVGECWLPRSIVCTNDGLVITQFTIESWREVMPHDRARWTPPPEPEDSPFDTSAAATLPVRRLASGHLAVEVSINDTRRWMTLDTGASWSIITPTLAKELGLTTFAKLNLRTLRGVATANWVEADEMRIGPLRMPSNKLLVTPMPDYVAKNKEKPVGTLGYDFFRRVVLDLDLGAHTLMLHPREHKRDTDWLPIALHAFTPYVEGELLGRFRGHFLLDLGDPNDAVLSKRFVAANDLEKAGALSRPTRSSRASRRYEVRRAKTFRVGNRQDGNLPVLLAKQHQHAYESSRLAGRLGLGYLRSARLWLDYGRGRIAIE